MTLRKILFASFAVTFLLSACESGEKYKGKNMSAWMYDLTADEAFKRQGGCEAMAHYGATAAEATPKLVTLLDDPNEGVQEFAAEALGKIGETAVPALEETLARPEPAVRMHAATALAAINPSHAKAGQELAKAVTGVGNAELAARAQDVVTHMGGTAVPFLLPFLDDPYGPVRLQTLKTLGKIGKPAAAAFDRVAMAIKDKELKVRLEAIQTLGLIGEKDKVIPVLQGYLEDPEEEVGINAAHMLKYVGAYEGASGNEEEPKKK